MLIKRVSYSEQLAHLKCMYKGSKSRMYKNGFDWICPIKPTPLSQTYIIKISYHVNKPPKCYVISPSQLPLAEGATRLPHTYSSKKQRLCLYYPKYKEWNSSMYIATTIVHWAIQWLFFYEIWLHTGKWNGGGHGNWDVEFIDSK